MAIKADADILFEASWEVCNKVGGIYTVVSSKAAQALKYYRDGYFLIGPYFPQKAYGIFEETPPPEGFKEVFDKLRNEGIDCHYGKWLIKGEPQTILIEFTGFSENTDTIKKDLWDNFQVDSLNTGYHDFGEPVVWGEAVGRLIGELSNTVLKDKKIVGHFHEWLAGSALLYIKENNIPVKTVFTTHATMLGRTLASKDVDIYKELDNIDPRQAAYDNGVESKWLMEQACANNATVFTTVSEITGLEAEKLLGRKPEVLLFNGLDLDKFPTFEETSIKHRLFKSKIKDFLLYYFFPHYSFDLEKTFIFFLAGRYEFHDKGIDIFIQALGELNKRLKEEKSPRTIVAFFWVPGNVRGIKPEILEARTLFADVKETINDSRQEILHRITHTVISEQEIKKEALFDQDELQALKTKVRRLKKKEPLAPLSTHDLHNWDSDPIINGFKSVGLNNAEEDRVKVIFYPIYLTGADGLLDTSYYESMMGSHLGVFPSYYEPWGYTPLEGAALGVPSITTNLAGFGRYLQKDSKPSANPGIWVMNRLGEEDATVKNALSEVLYYYATLTKQERIKNKIAARTLAGKADWKFFFEHYIQAHNLALKS